jgi:hypothetical protein
MLNLTDISQRIAHPEKCDISDFEDLKSFSTQYPYCQLFPILSLKALANNTDLRFDVELAQCAYRISDRSQLYALIHQNVAVKSIENSTEETESITEGAVPLRIVAGDEEKKEIDTKISVKEEAIEEPKNELTPLQPTNESASFADEESDDENDSEFIPLNISSSELTFETEELSKDEVEIESLNETPAESEETNNKDAHEDAQIDEFERRMLAETLSSAYRLEELAPEEDDVSDEQEHIDPENTNEAAAATPNRSFSDWLRVGNQSSNSEIEEDKSKLDDILDRFIENEPKISRPKAAIEEKPKRAFYSPEKKAKESVDMQHMPVSETLGKIFELQGNYPKAIFVYEQLILANPEKKSYFVARIEELNKKINS